VYNKFGRKVMSMRNGRYRNNTTYSTVKQFYLYLVRTAGYRHDIIEGFLFFVQNLRLSIKSFKV